MTLLLEANYLGFFIGFYLIAHSPAIFAIIVGFTIYNKRPKTAKRLWLLSTLYFIVGVGICGSMFIR